MRYIGQNEQLLRQNIRIYAAAHEGQSIEQIARSEGLGEREVELIIATEHVDHQGDKGRRRPDPERERRVQLHAAHIDRLVAGRNTAQLREKEMSTWPPIPHEPLVQRREFPAVLSVVKHPKHQKEVAS